MNEAVIKDIVREVIQEFSQNGVQSTPSIAQDQMGVYETIDQAVAAAKIAQEQLMELSLQKRGDLIQVIRDAAHQYAEDFSKRTLEETGMGRLEHKIAKHHLAARAPGIEDLECRAFTGDRGLTIHENAPYGVIGAVTPSTHPCPTMINNAISLISGGNSAVFNPHPASKEVFAYSIDKINKAIINAGGPANLLTCPKVPTLETAKDLFEHPNIRLLLVTGGPGVVRAALKSNKKAICAGPGNPPIVVDETADLGNAAHYIIEGAAFENNILCVGEKEVFCVSSVMDQLKKEMLARKCVELNSEQIEKLSQTVFDIQEKDGTKKVFLRRDLVGKNASILADRIGLQVPQDTELLIGETGADHLFVIEEQMMPFLPLVRCSNVDEAIEHAIRAEQGNGHTAMMHSRNVENMSKMARVINTTIFVKNGSCLSGMGYGGEGFSSFSIASPTGEGLTTARNFTRMRRCTLVDSFRIV